jgi:hypothetical protein
MKTILTLFLLLNSYIFVAQNNVNYIELSQVLLTNIKNDKDFKEEVSILKSSTLKELTAQLQNDNQKKAFWINIYNAFIQISLQDNPEEFTSRDRGKFFSKPRVDIAGQTLSFDDIEHGIIRKSRAKWSLGYLRKWFRPEWERKLRVDDVDWRIHFALNCGAKSCPPIAIYSAKQLDQELDFMTKTYLSEQTTYDENTKTAKTVALMSWFRGDFGGKNGAEKILAEYNITRKKPKNLEFKTYDWTLSLGNYRELSEL